MNKILQTILLTIFSSIFAVIFTLLGFKYFADYTERTLLERFDKIGAEIEQECMDLRSENDQILNRHKENYEYLYCMTKCNIPYMTNIMKRESCSLKCIREFKKIN